jgi:hypothetical protein
VDARDRRAARAAGGGVRPAAMDRAHSDRAAGAPHSPPPGPPLPTRWSRRARPRVRSRCPASKMAALRTGYGAGGSVRTAAL